MYIVDKFRQFYANYVGVCRIFQFPIRKIRMQRVKVCEIKFRKRNFRKFAAYIRNESFRNN